MKYLSNPRQLFLLDGLGAILSSFLLGIVLVHWENLFRVPKSTLYFLAFLPVLFALYDLYCYKIVKKNLASYLKGIAWMNLLYCIISIGFTCFHYKKITSLALAYFIIEILIVLAIAIIELKTANIISTESDSPTT